MLINNIHAASKLYLKGKGRAVALRAGGHIFILIVQDGGRRWGGHEQVLISPFQVAYMTLIARLQIANFASSNKERKQKKI